MQAITEAQINAKVEDLDNQIVTMNGDQYTVGQLRSAFNESVHGQNWKKAIDCTMNGQIAEINLVNAAIIFHVGGKNKIQVVAHCNNGSLTVRIRNPGYYHNIGT